MRSIVKLNKFRFSTNKLASLPDLAYDYGELQPVISPQLLEIHHKKHH
jgi:Fe-Mn family superoxide dismutase